MAVSLFFTKNTQCSRVHMHTHTRARAHIHMRMYTLHVMSYLSPKFEYCEVCSMFP